MSLALKQEIATVEATLDVQGADVHKISKDLVQLHKKLNEADTQAKVKKPVAQKEAGKKIDCRDCKQMFFLPETESKFFLEHDMVEPVRCSSCRAERKNKKTLLPCCDCKAKFEFTEADQVFFKKNSWPQPTRCIKCRAAKKAAVLAPKTLTCTGCKKEHIFSVAGQKHFKEQGWSEPIRCFQCRRENQSKLQAEALAVKASAEAAKAE